MRTLMILTIWLYAVCCIATSAAQPLGDSPGRYKDFLPALTCQNCHDTIFDQYSESQHAKAFSDPLFQAQYFKEILPQAEKDPGLFMRQTLHSMSFSVDSIKRKALITSKDQVDTDLSGVACDFCHTIKGYDGKVPENGISYRILISNVS